MTEIIIKAINISTPVSAKMRGAPQQWQLGLQEEASLGLRLVRVLYAKFQFRRDGLCALLDCTVLFHHVREGRDSPAPSSLWE